MKEYFAQRRKGAKTQSAEKTLESGSLFAPLLLCAFAEKFFDRKL